MLNPEEIENWNEEQTVEESTGEMLKEFISTFEASLDPRLWIKLVEEETKEVLEALENTNKEALLKEVSDLMYVTIGFNLTVAGAEQLGLLSVRETRSMMDKLNAASDSHSKAMKKLGNLNYFEAFSRVHRSNMSKLDKDGKPIKREDGKILKGPNYKEPTLKDLV